MELIKIKLQDGETAWLNPDHVQVIQGRKVRMAGRGGVEYVSHTLHLHPDMDVETLVSVCSGGSVRRANLRSRHPETSGTA